MRTFLPILLGTAIFAAGADAAVARDNLAVLPFTGSTESEGEKKWLVTGRRGKYLSIAIKKETCPYRRLKIENCRKIRRKNLWQHTKKLKTM
jgi:hypothetical protein